MVVRSLFLAVCSGLLGCSGTPDPTTDPDPVVTDATTDTDGEPDTDTDTDTAVATGDTGEPTDTDAVVPYDVTDFTVDIEAYSNAQGAGTGNPDICTGSATFEVDGTELTGTGSCNSQISKAVWTFDFTGTVTGTELDGTAEVTHFSARTEDIPFTGTLDATTLSASFEHTWAFTQTSSIDLASDFEGVAL